MFNTTEVITVKNFMARNYHMDAMGAIGGVIFTMSLPAYYIVKFGKGATVAFKVAAPLVLAL